MAMSSTERSRRCRARQKNGGMAVMVELYSDHIEAIAEAIGWHDLEQFPDRIPAALEELVETLKHNSPQEFLKT
jgi:hypothetical protein